LEVRYRSVIGVYGGGKELVGGGLVYMALVRESLDVDLVRAGDIARGLEVKSRTFLNNDVFGKADAEVRGE